MSTCTASLFGVKGTELRMPALSPTMTEDTIIKCLKHEGDSLQPGNVLCEIQSHKAIIAYKVEEEGVLSKILKDANSGVVQLNAPIGLVVEEGQDCKDVEVSAGEDATAPTTPSPASAAPPEATQAKQSVGANAKATMVGPAVKHLFGTYGLKADDLQSTFPTQLRRRRRFSCVTIHAAAVFLGFGGETI
ncbi:uncharacterized protein LOC144163896 [Haemaphysalis longicornis]